MDFTANACSEPVRATRAFLDMHHVFASQNPKSKTDFRGFDKMHLLRFIHRIGCMSTTGRYLKWLLMENIYKAGKPENRY